MERSRSAARLAGATEPDEELAGVVSGEVTEGEEGRLFLEEAVGEEAETAVEGGAEPADFAAVLRDAAEEEAAAPEEDGDKGDEEEPGAAGLVEAAGAESAEAEEEGTERAEEPGRSSRLTAGAAEQAARRGSRIRQSPAAKAFLRIYGTCAFVKRILTDKRRDSKRRRVLIRFQYSTDSFSWTEEKDGSA